MNGVDCDKSELFNLKISYINTFLEFLITNGESNIEQVYYKASIYVKMCFKSWGKSSLVVDVFDLKVSRKFLGTE